MQVEYLEKVFHMIDREKRGNILNKMDLVENERHSYEWCIKFNVPVISSPSHEVVGSHIDRPISFQQ